MTTEAPQPATETQSTDSLTQSPLWARLIATFLGAGRIQPAPGTWGSICAILVWAVLGDMTPRKWLPAALGILIFLAIVLGIPAATRICRSLGIKDPQVVVIDEVAGQWITLLFAPVTWKSAAVGFILFRGFDIVKPPPIRQLERLPEGTGIVADDVAAGIYALVIMQVLLHVGFLR